MGATSTGSANQNPHRRLTFLEKFLIIMNTSLIGAIFYKLFH